MGVFTPLEKIFAPYFAPHTHSESVRFVYLSQYLCMESVFWMQSQRIIKELRYFIGIMEAEYSIILIHFIFHPKFSVISLGVLPPFKVLLPIVGCPNG